MTRKLKHKRVKYKRNIVYPFLSRMYKLFREEPEMFKLCKLANHTHGMYLPDDREIHIDYRRDFISTLIHEVIHHFYPDWCESRVLKEESKIVNALSPVQVKNILKKYSQFL